MAQYRLTITDPYGNPLKEIVDFYSLSYARRVNEQGALSIVLPTGYKNYLQHDYRILIERIIDGYSYLEGETAWTINKVTSSYSGGIKMLQVEAADSLSILATRIIAYNAGIVQSQKNGKADDVMKNIVLENFTSTATDTSRAISGFQVEAKRSEGPQLQKGFAWRNVLDVLKEVSQASAALGTQIYFDVVLLSDYKTLEFRTYKKQRGTDRTYPGGQKPLLLAPELGNLTDITRVDDYSQAYTFIYVGGQGQEADRQIVTASDSAAILGSPFGRREYFQDARNTDDPNEMTGEANSALFAGKPKMFFEASLVETPRTRYGIEYGLGDRVTAQYEGEYIDCLIDAVQITVDGTGEKIDTRIRNN